MKDFKEKLSLVPNKPGSYQMKNKDGIIIYVGKAKNLKNRLKSYFTGNIYGKTRMLVNDIEDFEYIVTSTELESLILEITLIKKYNPKYNIMLKDDKTYPYIEFTKEKYPRLRVVRNVKRKKDKNYLYGPYPNVLAARKTVNMINRIYPLRKCERMPKELCLYYHIDECLGYCKYKIEEEKIVNMKKEIIKFLRGDSTLIKEKIIKQMDIYSEKMNYEKALEYKEMLNDIDITLSKQKIDLNDDYNFDLVNYYEMDNYLAIEIFFVRDGLLVGRNQDVMLKDIDCSDQLVEYIIKFYEKLGIMPKELLVASSIDSDLLSKYFNIKVTTPVKGKLNKLLNLALENAKEYLQTKLENIKADDNKRLEALLEFKNILKTDRVSRIEAFDNSHLFSTFYVGAMVVYDDFIKNKDLYRKFKISVDVKDDINAMKEVIYRRYFKLIMDEEKQPDIIVVDGGYNQVKVCKEIIDELNLDIIVIGLAKDNKHRTNNIVLSDGSLVDIKNSSNLYVFLAKIQEEVHRFAISYHRNIKSKGLFTSVLDFVPGIGEVRKKDLLKRFSSLKKMREASLLELEEIVPKEVAKKLYDYLQEI